MLEAARRVVAERRPHAGIELLFTPKEEVGLLGAYAFDHTRLEAQRRLRLRPGGADRRDHPRRAVRARDRGRASTAAPRTRAWPRRRAARRSPPRRARSPTCGSAGSTRRRPRTSALIAGGTRAQHRPRVVRRSRRRRARTTSGKLADARPGDARRVRVRRRAVAECAVETEVQRAVPRLPLPAATTRRAARARRARALRASSRRTALSGGGADANVFNERGLPCVNLANGMTDDPHARRAHRGRRPRARWST